MILRTSFFLCCCCIFICTTSGQCTARSDISPCVCEYNGVETAIVCNNVTRQPEIDRLSSRTEDYQFDNFVLKDSTISAVPQQLILDKSFGSLHIVKSHLGNLFQPIPENISDIDAVQLDRVSIDNGLNWSQFKNLVNLKSLHFRKLDIPSLNEDFQKSISVKLINLELTETNTSFIVDNAFATMENLVDIRIQNNEVSQLKRSMFPTYSKIETLFFNDNRITNLPDDLFYGMGHLIRVGLENNEISFLSESLFDRFYNQFTVLALKGNPIKCDCSLRWIAKRNKYNHEQYITGECVHPKRVARKEIFVLTEEDFNYCQ